MIAQRTGIALLFLLGLLFSRANVGFAQSNSQIADLIDANQPKMVKVFGASAGRVEGYGTGFLVSANGEILTAQGIYLDGLQVKVVTNDGNEYEATIVKRDRTLQLALLKIEIDDADYFELSDTPVGEKGDWIVALTNAFKVADQDDPVSAMIGTITLRSFIEAKLTKRDVAYRGDIVLIDTITSNPGAAGGAVITLGGQLVGMTGKIINSSDTNTRLNYCVPSYLLKQFVDGTLPAEVSDAVAETGQADMGFGLFKLGGRRNPAYIDRIVAGGAAEAAGLAVDDMIVSIAGSQVGTVKECEAAIDELVPNEEVLIVVKRGRELLRLPITPGKADK
ncbi:MAG: S1C family serine protease [Pirellulaceae bacterium]